MSGAVAKRRADPSLLLFGLIALVLVVLVVLPLAWLAWYSVTNDAGALSLDNFRQIATDPALLKPMRVTLVIAVASAAGAAAVAVPLAWLVARTDVPWRGAIRATSPRPTRK